MYTIEFGTSREYVRQKKNKTKQRNGREEMKKKKSLRLFDPIGTRILRFDF